MNRVLTFPLVDCRIIIHALFLVGLGCDIRSRCMSHVGAEVVLAHRICRMTGRSEGLVGT